MNTAHNIYIHVPFCMSKCNYCAFFSHACAAPDWNKYTADITSEIEYWADKLGPIDIPTIFFGGGTPSLMPCDAFSQIMNKINSRFHIPQMAEITLESNPGTLNDKKLAEFAAHGVNRLSIGVQSLDNDKLIFLGRKHDAQTAISLIKKSQQMKLRTSADFIYGIPGDTAKSVRDTCRQINDLGLTHCSMYELTIESGTPFGKMNLRMPSNSEMADMYNVIDETLNLSRYEVSNYSAPGDECRHNQNIWDGGAYIGIGRGAAGRPFFDGTWHEQLGAHARLEKMSNRDRAIEKIITGMRTMRGVKLSPDVIDAIDMEYVNNDGNNLVTIENGRIRATQSGILILDDIMVKLVK